MNESGRRWCLMAGDWHLRCGFTMSVSTSWNARTGMDFWLVLLIGFYDSACLMKQKGDVKIDTGYIATDNGTRFGSVDMTVGHMCCLASLTVWISD